MKTGLKRATMISKLLFKYRKEISRHTGIAVKKIYRDQKQFPLLQKPGFIIKTSKLIPGFVKHSVLEELTLNALRKIIEHDFEYENPTFHVKL